MSQGVSYRTIQVDGLSIFAMTTQNESGAKCRRLSGEYQTSDTHKRATASVLQPTLKARTPHIRPGAHFFLRAGACPS
jgi:hypothetical protein